MTSNDSLKLVEAESEPAGSGVPAPWRSSSGPNPPPGDGQIDRPPLPATWRELLFPFLLLAMALLVVGLSWHKTRIENPTPVAPSSLAAPALSPAARISEAGVLNAEADKLWIEGYKWINDHLILRESRNKYRQAWELVTGHSWPEGRQSLVIESPQAKALRDHLELRIFELDHTLDGSWWRSR